MGCRKLGIPLNPNKWSRLHVLKWVHYISISTQTNIDFEKFSMNGRGLCYISLDGFINRSPECGKFLHSELQKKLISHVYLLVLKSKSQKIHNRCFLYLDKCFTVDVLHFKIYISQLILYILINYHILCFFTFSLLIDCLYDGPGFNLFSIFSLLKQFIVANKHH